MVVAPEPGLADVLAGRDLSEALHVGMHPGLTLLPAGLPTSRSSDLAGSARMQTLIEELAVRFDIVIVDTPPLFAASDALALVNEASGAVVVARIDHTSRRSLGRAAQILKRAGAKVLGSAVTGINREAHRLPSALARPAEPREIVQAPGG
jgi:tyrosine-protein kinase Etk/Wzc